LLDDPGGCHGCRHKGEYNQWMRLMAKGDEVR
jgi:hypothetical protein